MRSEIHKAYIEPYGLNQEEVLVLDLHYGPGKKTPAKEMKAWIEQELKPTLDDFEVQYLVVADSDYFKVLTGAAKTEANLGYVMDCKFGPWKVIYVPNFRTIFYDPVKVTAKIEQGMLALTQHKLGSYVKPGEGIIQYERYPKTLKEIEQALEWLLLLDVPLAIDIETFHLKPHKAGIGTIAFAWSKHEGIAFAVDYEPINGATEAPFGRQALNEPVRHLLRKFFERYTQRALYHHIAFDVSVLIYQLYMTDILDTNGLLHGLETLLRNWHCTKLIAYLATNSCAGNKLSLKDLAQEFAGNYGLGGEIKDITKIPLDTLLRYNLVDGCSTWFVYEKHWDTLVADQQLDIYEQLFQPATVDIVQMQLTGLPVDMKRVTEVKLTLMTEQQQALDTLHGSRIGQEFTHRLNEKWVIKRNQELKVKRVSMDDANEVFNPNSGPQLQDLLYEMLGLPIIEKTDSGLPATGGDTLKDLKNHTKNADIHTFLDALITYGTVATVMETFIPALENAVPGPDGWHYLCGNFNLGGTLSGRLSSSDPNLQNIPAGGEGEKTLKGRIGKLIKSCIAAPFGWILVGLDFASLEDRISALTTRDPNKLKVYTDGYDGHSMRAYSYWGDRMPDIDPNLVESINSIAEKYTPERQASKPPTFALTYQGTYKTLMTNCGFSESEAKRIEASFKKLYKVSIDWVDGKLKEACKTGYVTVAFGLRVRTPLLAQVIRGTRKTPHEAEAEGRSAGNALGQSWCLLNSRAWVEFMGKVRKSNFRTDIRPCAQIHDAGYALVRDDVAAIAYCNEHLVEAVKWQDHPDIWHDQVKLGGELSIFWPSWAKEIVIPNGANENDIIEIIEKKMAA
jgi:DNA polymerase-1